MNRQDIVNELRDRGYVAEIKDVKKNGTVLKGIVIIGEANPTPIIYTDKIIENENSVSSAADMVLSVYKEHSLCDIQMEDILKAEYLKDKLFITLCNAGAESVNITRHNAYLEGVDDCLAAALINTPGKGAIMKIPEELLKKIGMKEETAWEIARANTVKNAHIGLFGDVLAGMIKEDGEGEELIEAAKAVSRRMVIASNANKFHGAGVIYAMDRIKRTANADKIIVIPSSIHELIIYKYDEDMDIEDFNYMVKEVNKELDPEDVLSDRVYVL